MAEQVELAGYHVVATLGRGARSTIYRVRNGLGEDFVLKRVVKNSSKDQRFIDQALTEHEVASQLDHPHLRKSLKLFKQRQLIRVSEVLVLMELIEGHTLESQGMDDLPAFCRICAQVADGLGAMHEAGFVHADIKPNNIMRDGQGVVKLIDFGQSCPIGTVKERIQGTPDYIAPEQVKRQAIVPQTDVFNLGATMYWLLTGRFVPTLIPKDKAGVQPPTGTPVTAASQRVEPKAGDGEACPPPHELNESVPPALSILVTDCIQHAVADRPADMAEVAHRLEVAQAQMQRRAGGSAETDGEEPRHTDAAERDVLASRSRGG